MGHRALPPGRRAIAAGPPGTAAGNCRECGEVSTPLIKGGYKKQLSSNLISIYAHTIFIIYRRNDLIYQWFNFGSYFFENG